MGRHFLEDEFDVAEIGLEFAQDLVDQRPILDHEQVGVENPGVLRPDRFGDPLLHFENLGARLDERRLEPADFVRDLGRLDAMARDLVAIIAHHMDRSPGDAGGNPNALKSRLLFRVIAAHPERVARVSMRESCRRPWRQALIRNENRLQCPAAGESGSSTHQANLNPR